LRLSRPVRTVHATFTAYGSSMGQRIREDTRSPHWPWGLPGRYYGRAGYRIAYGGGSRTSQDPCDPADRSALLPAPVGCPFPSANTRGKSAGFPWGEVVTPIRPVTCRPSLPPSSSTRCPVSSPCGSPSRGFSTGGQRAYHVSRVERPGGLGCASTPVVQRLRVPSSERHHLPTYLLVQASQHLWLVLCDGACGTSPGLALPPHPGPRPPWCWQSSPLPHGAVTWCDSPRGRAALADAGNPNTASLVWKILQRIRCPGSFAPSRCQGRTSR
jgi:hypothetical protein